MRIETINLNQGLSYKQNTGVGSDNKFSDVLNIAKECTELKKVRKDSYAKSMECIESTTYTKLDTTQQNNDPIVTERYKIADASYMEGVPAYEIADKMSGTTLYLRENQIVIQRDEKTGFEFIMNMDLDQPVPQNILVTDELKNLLGDLAEKRNFDVKETGLQGGLVVNRDIRTGINYLSVYGNESKAVSLIITSEKDIEVLNKLSDEFQQYSVSSQRETAGLYSLLEISGNLKREKEGFVYLTPMGLTYIPYDGDSSKAWETDIPNSYLSKVRDYLATGEDCTDINTWMNMIKGIKVYYADSNRDVLANSSLKYDDMRKQYTYDY